jgi:uncharacterized BrkB/YihY/UPF0761 family membrane protein
MRGAGLQEVPWWDALRGGIISAILSEIGKVAVVGQFWPTTKVAIAWYVAWAGRGSACGAAGSLVVLPIWFQYLAQIVLFSCWSLRKTCWPRQHGLVDTRV